MLCTPVQRPTGARPSFAANTMRSTAPVTKLGTLIPTTDTSCVQASANDPGRSAPTSPTTVPTASAIAIAANPIDTETGTPAARISFTVRSGCARLGPRSNGFSARPSAHEMPLARPR
jgi:hypothetical protein